MIRVVGPRVRRMTSCSAKALLHIWSSCYRRLNRAHVGTKEPCSTKHDRCTVRALNNNEQKHGPRTRSLAPARHVGNCRKLRKQFVTKVLSKFPRRQCLYAFLHPSEPWAGASLAGDGRMAR